MGQQDLKDMVVGKHRVGNDDRDQDEDDEDKQEKSMSCHGDGSHGRGIVVVREGSYGVKRDQ